MPTLKRPAVSTRHLASCVAFAVLFVVSVLFALVNRDDLKRPFFAQTTDIVMPLVAKYEEDGNIYVIDSASLRLFAMKPNGVMRYEITVDKFKTFEKIINCAADKDGRLYVCFQEFDYNAAGVKRDSVRVYDSNGRFVKNLLTINYTVTEATLYNLVQTTTMETKNRVLTFTRLTEYGVEMYRYDTRTDLLEKRNFGTEEEPFDTCSLSLFDIDSYAYITRGGEIYEVRSGGAPRRRAAFSFSQESGGMLPDVIKYADSGYLLFLDNVSGEVYQIDTIGNVRPFVPKEMFAKLDHTSKNAESGQSYDESGGKIAGIFNGQVWYYDGREIKAYTEATHPPLLHLRVILAQLSVWVALLSLVIAIFILQVRILDWYMPIFVKQAALIVIIVAIGVFSVYQFLYNSITKTNTDELRRNLLFLANRAASEIDGDVLASLTCTDDYYSDTYASLVKALRKGSYSGTDDWKRMYYATVMRTIDDGNTLVFLADSMNEALLFVPYTNNYYITEESDPLNYSLLHDGKSITDIEFDSFGYWAYADTMIYTSAGEPAGFLELGFDATFYEMENRTLSRTIALQLLEISGAILIAIGVTMLFMTRRLRRVMAALARIGAGDYSARLQYKGHDELGDLCASVNIMSGQIEDYIKHITEITVEKERINNELELAAQIQNDMLPPIERMSEMGDNIHLYAKMETAREVGGDFYDFFFIDEAKTKLGIVIADVSGKGMPASLLMVVAKTLVKRALQKSNNLVETMLDLNQSLVEDNPRSMFVTVFLLTIDLESGIMRYVNGGHNAPLLSLEGGPFEYMELEDALPVGLFPCDSYALCTIQLHAGDRLYLYTDGVTEAMTDSGAQFGEERLLEAANRFHAYPPQEFDQAIRSEVKAFTEGAELSDDMTSVAILYTGSALPTPQSAKPRFEHELVLSAQVQELERLLDWIYAIIEAHPCPSEALNQICVVCEEIFVNIANYAYAEGTPEEERLVTVRFNFDGAEATLQIEDAGIPFDPLQKADPDLTVEPEDRLPGGLGIYFVRSWMSSVSYERSGGKNILTMTKRL